MSSDWHSRAPQTRGLFQVPSHRHTRRADLRNYTMSIILAFHRLSDLEFHLCPSAKRRYFVLNLPRIRRHMFSLVR